MVISAIHFCCCLNYNRYIIIWYLVFTLCTEFSYPFLKGFFTKNFKQNQCPVLCHHSSFFLILSLLINTEFPLLCCHSILWNIPSLLQPDLSQWLQICMKLYLMYKFYPSLFILFLLSVMNILSMSLHRYSGRVPALEAYWKWIFCCFNFCFFIFCLLRHRGTISLSSCTDFDGDRADLLQRSARQHLMWSDCQVLLMVPWKQAGWGCRKFGREQSLDSWLSLTKGISCIIGCHAQQ